MLVSSYLTVSPFPHYNSRYNKAVFFSVALSPSHLELSLTANLLYEVPTFLSPLLAKLHIESRQIKMTLQQLLRLATMQEEESDHTPNSER